MEFFNFFNFLRVKDKLKPTGWKSESFLNKKENNRSKSEDPKPSESGSIFYTTKPLSKSSDWTDVELEVPTKEDEHIHLRNPKLNLIFDNEKGTPTPPPRKQHQEKGNFREKIERFAAKSLQALQGDKKKDVEKEPIPIEEPLMVKKKINYSCPLCESDEKTHNRDHHHHNQKPGQDSPKKPKSGKRLKNLSIVSLPNYTDLRLSVANPIDVDAKSASKNDLASSRLSLQHPDGKKLTTSQSTGKLDSYITRCRSLGSLFPQQLKKMKLQKTKPADITSDDSFGPLEDWDLGLIEHYNPKDASLPRARKPLTQKSDKDILDGIADLVVQEEDVEETPKRPVRRSESLVKKINDETSKQQHVQVQKSPEDICLTPPPSPERSPRKTVAQLKGNFEESTSQKTKVPAAIKRNKPDFVEAKKATVEKRASVSEHSTLMKILQEYSIKDKQEKVAVPENDSNLSSLTPSLVEFEKTLSNNLTEDFINAEKRHTRAVCS
ncbi:uncharacterized protein LOC126735721 isoform X2 [Anthonomus grandis grandis]|uniref:uncharacterized protein LOC126735721 isoform X2 n=1 Tax=Anthonomus grandis grandis TaxID=2921223 RepID=UPI0021661048|nr:uncharacterized protein LOC126735721 isoform X2 [Anthonomus grandis grandis]